MANRDSAVLTSYDSLRSSPSPESETCSASLSSTVTNSSNSSRTIGNGSPSLTLSSKQRSGRRRTIIFGTVSDCIP